MIPPTPSDPRKDPDGEIERARRQRQSDGTAPPELPGSRETFPERTKKPGEAGLANEARPGLGTRAEEDEWRNDPGAGKSRRKPRVSVHDKGEPKATPRGYEEPRPEPREQDPNSLAHEEERSTGVSGHMGMS